MPQLSLTDRGEHPVCAPSPRVIGFGAGADDVALLWSAAAWSAFALASISQLSGVERKQQKTTRASTFTAHLANEIVVRSQTWAASPGTTNLESPHEEAENRECPTTSAKRSV